MGRCRFDAALVCTAPITHAKIIGELLDAGLPVFTELNLVDDGYDELTAKAREKGLPLFLSSTMLYRAETQYIKAQVAAFKKPVNYIYHIGQYLPDWHPWENYKNFFVGDKRTGGVREIFGIDWDGAAGDKVPVDTYESFEHDSRYSDNIVENAYVDELANFFGVLAGRETPRWSFEKDKEVIALIERIEQSGEE